MKACVVQPAYSYDYEHSDALFEWEMNMLDSCDESMDLIVFPEYSNVPALAKTKEQALASYEKYAAPLMKKACETARRCQATVFINGLYMTETGLRNTTTAISKTGEIAGHYFKQHLVPSEMYTYELDKAYTYEPSEPTILEVDGVRYGFLVCYDMYFYESFANIARHDPDVMIVCAYQRSDTHAALEMMSRFCAYNCNSYVIRSSVSLGADSPVGGSSMIVAPDSTVLCELGNTVGCGTAEIDPHKRYLKPAGFGNPDAPHHHYIENGRRPWKYRPAGPAIVLPDDLMPYPRMCAHRGFSTIAPENSLPAFGAAVALGAHEIEFDLWASKDGEIISLHDDCLDRVSTGSGFIYDLTYEELKQFDFGIKHGTEFEGLGVLRLEELLEKLAGHTVMNVHIKHVNDTDPLPEATLQKIIDHIDRYDCRKWCYFMSGNPAILEQLQRLAPDIDRCAGADGNAPCEDLVDKALKYGCTKIQLFKPFFGHNEPDYLEKAVAKAHANGIRCNIFWSDDPEETKRYLEMGIDTILTNDFQRNANVLHNMKK
ncbi:MAG: hypothetical protein IKC46_00910 [Lachnospiraceae bacterium]|nr:hypothetical protein [Lachnospiraceae bacterium]